MSGGVSDGESDVVTDSLLRLYRRYLGEPEQLSDVYVGFACFFGGVAMAAVAVVVFLWSNTLPAELGMYWQLREVALSLAMLALPVFLLGVVVLLPRDRRALAGAAAGLVVSALAVGLFVVNYPGNWNTTGSDASATGVTVYALGVVLATAAVGASLVSNYIARAETTPAGAGASESTAETGGTAASSGADVSDDQVRADIDAALSDTELSWGGVEKDDTKRLKITTDETDIDRSGFDDENVTERRSAGGDVDDAVSGLKQLRGGETEEATGEGTDDQADALRQLRERQQAEAETDDESVVDRVRDRLGF